MFVSHNKLTLFLVYYVYNFLYERKGSTSKTAQKTIVFNAARLWLEILH